MKGLYEALRSGYKFFYAPITDDQAANLHSTALRAGKALGKNLKVGQRIILNPSDNTYSKILLIEVLGDTPEALEIKRRKQEKIQNKLDKIAKIKKYRKEGLTYKEIAHRLGYQAGDSVIKLLKEEPKLKKENGEEITDEH